MILPFLGRPLGFSPHTRGWSGSGSFPVSAALCSPRTRWDGPPGHALDQLPVDRSPRTRGEGPEEIGSMFEALQDLPAHAGMVRASPR